MLRFALTLLLALTLTLPAQAMTEEYAVGVVVDLLRVRLQQSERYRAWDEEFQDWWTVYDLRPHEGFW